MVKPGSVIRLAAVCVASTAVLSACVVAPYPQRQVVYSQPGAGEAEVIVDVPPPSPVVEVRPIVPFLGAIWISGYWGWSQGRHMWMPGHYDRPRAGYRWEPHYWGQGPGGHWHLRGGGWVR